MYDVHSADNILVYRSWKNSPETNRQFRIVILKLDHIGDFWMSLKPLRAIRSRFPTAHITLVVGSWNINTAKKFDLADEYVCFDFFARSPAAGKAGRKSATEIGSVLSGRFDLAIDMRVPNDTRDVLLATPADMRAAVTDSAGSRGIGISIEAPKIKLRRNILYKLLQRSPLFGKIPRSWFDGDVDAAQRGIRHISDTLSLLVARVSDYYEQQDRSESARDLAVGGDIAPIVVAPFSNSSLRDWPIQNFRELVARISRFNSVVLIGRSENRAELLEISQSVPLEDRGNVSVVTDLTEDGFNALLSSASLVVSNNSGAGHVAAQLGRPTVGIFSASHLPDLWGFQGPNVSMLMSSIECRGCGLDVVRRCPIQVRCKIDVTVDAVLAEIAVLVGIPALVPVSPVSKDPRNRDRDVLMFSTI